MTYEEAFAVAEDAAIATRTGRFIVFCIVDRDHYVITSLLAKMSDEVLIGEVRRPARERFHG